MDLKKTPVLFFTALLVGDSTDFFGPNPPCTTDLYPLDANDGFLGVARKVRIGYVLGKISCGQPTVELEKSVGKSTTLAWSSQKSPPGECAFSRE